MAGSAGVAAAETNHPTTRLTRVDRVSALTTALYDVVLVSMLSPARTTATGAEDGLPVPCPAALSVKPCSEPVSRALVLVRGGTDERRGWDHRRVRLWV